MKIVIAIGGSILLKEYDCKKFQAQCDDIGIEVTRINAKLS